jgi:hypothetical protein
VVESVSPEHNGPESRIVSYPVAARSQENWFEILVGSGRQCAQILSPCLNLAPSSSLPTGAYTRAENSAPLQDDKAGLRVDGNTRFGLLSGYYFIDKYSLVFP